MSSAIDSFLVVYSDGTEERYQESEFDEEVVASIKSGILPRRIEGLDRDGNVIAQYDYGLQIFLTAKERNSNVKKIK